MAAPVLRRGFSGPRFSFPPEERISEVAGCLPMVSTAVSAPPAVKIADRRAGGVFWSKMKCISGRMGFFWVLVGVSMGFCFGLLWVF